MTTTITTNGLAEELRTAATALRCDHRFPVQPPDGSFTNPGACNQCGIRCPGQTGISDEQAEPVADMLTSIADDMADQDAVEGSASKAVHSTTMLGLSAPRNDWTAALHVARAINGPVR